MELGPANSAVDFFALSGVAFEVPKAAWCKQFWAKHSGKPGILSVAG
jgi:hypothetical protein